VKLPAHTLATRRCPGSPYVAHEIVIAGRVIYSQLSPMTDAEIAERVRAHVSPRPVAAARNAKPFSIRRAGRTRKGEAWRSNDEGYE
jgi:hypothetical protein